MKLEQMGLFHSTCGANPHRGSKMGQCIYPAQDMPWVVLATVVGIRLGVPSLWPFYSIRGSTVSSNPPGLSALLPYVTGDFARNWVGTARPFLGSFTPGDFRSTLPGTGEGRMTWVSSQKAHLPKDIGHALTAAFLVTKERVWHPSALSYFLISR